MAATSMNAHLLLLMLLFSSSFFFFLVVARKQHALETKEATTNHYHHLQTSSFLPSSVCTPSIKGDKTRGTLELVHKNGPCSPLNKDKVKPVTMEEILTLDQERVESIMLTINTNRRKENIEGSKATTLTQFGRNIGSINYIVTVGFGTPKRNFSLVLDTAADLTWIQCQPCSEHCYDQQEPIFSPSDSTTYFNISCDATECFGLLSATRSSPAFCREKICAYDIHYAQDSFSIGNFAKEKLTLTTEDVINDFYFGCGQNNLRIVSGAAGVLGLGRDKLSLVSQSAQKYGQVFSYCLPSQPNQRGFLTFGKDGIGSNVEYTPFTNSNGRSFYTLDLEAILVGGQELEISPEVFSSANMVMDSGTEFTRLPPMAYAALRTAFRAEMAKYNYPLTYPNLVFDTCYNFKNFSLITIPTITMVWGGNIQVDISGLGTLYATPGVRYQSCLAFIPNHYDTDAGIFGNIQQKSMEVVYDIPARKVGFATERCR